MGRHGEGYHNAAESYYGTPAWNCFYSELNGNATVTWADAHLTPNGVAQAQLASRFWASLITTQSVPLPQTYYTSPLYRCLDTANITFGPLASLLPPSQPFIPMVKELMRESLSAHTCDRRSNKNFIAATFPSYTFEAGFAESDPLWNETYAETDSAQVARSIQLLNDIFTTDPSTYISFTSHSGEIGAILAALGHIPFSLSTGAVIPALVRAETDLGLAPIYSTKPWTVNPTCTSPPANTATAPGKV
jgi:broad specificity phosphatase PhoE